MSEDHEPDAAAEAFEGVRSELALFRGILERLAADREEKREIPDYSETLGQMAKATMAIGHRIKVLEQVAQDNVVPRHIAERIVAVGAEAREEDRRIIMDARDGLNKLTVDLRGVVASARSSAEQRRQLTWALIGATLVGMLLWSVFAGVVARSVPANWHWPERMAARTLRMPMWEASRQLARTAAPENWNRMVAGAIIVQDNSQAIERCRRTATKVHEAVQCTVSVKPEKKGGT